MARRNKAQRRRRQEKVLEVLQKQVAFLRKTPPWSVKGRKDWPGPGALPPYYLAGPEAAERYWREDLEKKERDLHHLEMNLGLRERPKPAPELSSEERSQLQRGHLGHTYDGRDNSYLWE